MGRLVLQTILQPMPTHSNKTMNTRAKFMTILACLISIVCIISGFIFWMADPLYLKSPTDQRLITIFQEHRAAFEKLRQMASDDSQKESYFSQSSLGNQLNDARKSEYKTLLSEIHSGLIVTTDNQSVRFIFAHGGLSAIGPEWFKGIEYISGNSRMEGAILPNLNKPASLPVGGVYLMPIERGWFVIFQKTE